MESSLQAKSQSAVQHHPGFKQASGLDQASETWRLTEVMALFDLPFNDLLFQAHQAHRANFNVNEVQTSSLLSIKTGACPEDCKYCSQSGHYNTNLPKEN